MPFLEAERIVMTSGVQLPLWPLDLKILIVHKDFPILTSPNELINFLTGLVEARVFFDSQLHERRQTL